MVALNFSDRFVDLVASGRKRQSLRADKHYRLAVGRPLQLYTGMRTSKVRKLTPTDPVITERVYCAVRPDYLTLGGPGYPKIDTDEFAALDGFASYAEMVGWFQDTYKRPTFIGHCIRWAWLDAREAP